MSVTDFWPGQKLGEMDDGSHRRTLKVDTLKQDKEANMIGWMDGGVTKTGPLNMEF